MSSSTDGADEHILPGTAAVILAAGASTRLGERKQLVQLAGEPLLVRAARTAAEAGCAPVLVVLGAYAAEIAAAAGAHARWPAARIQLLSNELWQEGMASSIRLGIEHLHATTAVTGCLVMTCDQPLITPAHLAALSRRATGEVCATAYAGRKGVPAYLPRSAFAPLLMLHGDAGARTLLRDAAAIAFEDAAFDVDLPGDLGELCRRIDVGE